MAQRLAQSTGILCLIVLIFCLFGSVAVRADEPFPALPGDLNGDGVVTDDDAIYLLMHTFFAEDYPVTQDVDYDKDGSVTDDDAIWLLMYTFFPEDYPLTGGQAAAYELSRLDGLSYYLYTPRNPEPGMPLIIYLHGGTNKRENVTALLTTDGFPKYLYEGFYGDLRAYVAIPKLEESYVGWSDISDQLQKLVNALHRKCEIALNKVTLTGHSMGGTGTYQVQIALPDTFAGIAPMSGSVLLSAANLDALSKTRIRAFVGTDDTIVDPAATREIVAALIQRGADAVVTEFEGAGHFDVPALGYKGTDVIAWLLTCEKAK